MSTVTENMDELVRQVRFLAGTRDHRIAARQLAQLESQTGPALLALRNHLEGRPVREDTPAPAPGSIAAQVQSATDAALAAAQPKSREAHAGREVTRPGRRPGQRVTEEGIYYYEDKIYKVYRSEYGERRLLAKVLDPRAKSNRWSYAQGMMGVLRASDKMTAEQSIRFEALYDYAACTDCGATLENDLSRARRKGPVCYGKNGPNPGLEIDEIEESPEGS